MCRVVNLVSIRITQCQHGVGAAARHDQTDDARVVVNAARGILMHEISPKQKDQKTIRNMRMRWGVQLRGQKSFSWKGQLRDQKHYRPMQTVIQEIKTALIKRAVTLTSEAEFQTNEMPETAIALEK